MNCTQIEVCYSVVSAIQMFPIQIPTLKEYLPKSQWLYSGKLQIFFFSKQIFFAWSWRMNGYPHYIKRHWFFTHHIHFTMRERERERGNWSSTSELGSKHHSSGLFTAIHFLVCQATQCVCVCVWERERERESEGGYQLTR